MYDSADVFVRGGAGQDTLMVANAGAVDDVILLFQSRFNGGDAAIGNGQFETVILGLGNDLLVGDNRTDGVVSTSLEVFAGSGNDRISL